MIGQHWRKHSTCGYVLASIAKDGRLKPYHPASVSFCFANSSNLPGSVLRRQSTLTVYSWDRKLTSIEERHFPSVRLPEILSLVQSILRCAPLVNVGVVWVRHGCIDK